MESPSHPNRIEPGPGQESVWNFPIPPRVDTTSAHLVVVWAGETVAETRQGLRVVQTGQPPSYYFPPRDVRPELISSTEQRTFCEWKGLAHYWSVTAAGRTAQEAAWSYPDPTEEFRELADYLAFFPQLVDRCSVDGERARPTDGTYYGGWITSAIVGPFGPTARPD